MSSESSPADKTTPTKTPDSPSKEAVTQAVTPGTAAITPDAKSLNVNAKIFIPKPAEPEQPASQGSSPAQGAKVGQQPHQQSPSQRPPPMAGVSPMGVPPGFPGGVHPNFMGMNTQSPMVGMHGGFMAGGKMMMPPPMGGMPPPSPLAHSQGRPMAQGSTFHPSSPMMGGGSGYGMAAALAAGQAPSTPLTPAVSVGNATLVAKRSTAPPKFGCVLLAGVTGVGKTTIGNHLVQELSGDKIEWKFFCGADHLKDAPTAKPAPWDTTKSVFDGLSEYLDSLLAKQLTNPIRGLLIDKQLRGVEDLYYLTSLLRSKGLLLWGVLGMDCTNDEVLASRLGNTAGLNEKIKFHRVIYSRIQEASKAVGLWRTVDAGSSKTDSLKHLRTMVLGCSSQSPTKQFNGTLYHDSPIPVVDNYVTYASVMANLFTIIPRNAKGVAMFPGTTTYTPLPSAQVDSKKNPLKDYAVRRKVDGTKYILFYDGVKLFLIPRHMRCVFEMTQDAWLGVHLSNTGKFVVDGELVKISKDRSKEKFVVYDVLHWAEKGSAINLVARASWKDRQERLKTNLCSEGTAFFPKKGDIVVVHQATVDEPRLLSHLLEPTDYPCDGLVFHSTTRRDEAPIMWRAPESITVDFRLGAKTETDDGSVFIAEVFDTNLAKYNQFRTDTIEVSGSNRPTIIEGAIVACSLDVSGPTPSWVFQRVRSDLIASSLKVQVDEILKHCMVTKATMTEYVAALEAKANKEAGKAQDATAIGGGALARPGSELGSGLSQNKQPTLGGSVQPPVAPGQGASKQASRQVFGSALAGPGGSAPDQSGSPSMRDIVKGEHKPSAAKPDAAKPAGAGPQSKSMDNAMMTDAEKLSAVVMNIRVKNLTAAPSNDVALLSGMVGSVSVVGPEGGKNAGNGGNNGSSSASNVDKEDKAGEKKRGERECSECGETKHGRIDKRNSKVYCYDCWAAEGVEFCVECKDFASGHRELFSRRKKGDFFCDGCWITLEDEEAKKEARKSRDSGRSRRKD